MTKPLNARESYFVPDTHPTCCECDQPATVVTFISEQHFVATLTPEGVADENHCEPIGLPEKIGDELFYCDSCKPTE